MSGSRSKAPGSAGGYLLTFDPLETLTQEAEQLHLAHPLVKRILDRFLAQGYGAHDLSRVCGVVVPGERVPRVLAYGRLTLFGQNAARLHDEILAVVAPWPAESGSKKLEPYRDPVTMARARDAVEAALASSARGLPEHTAALVKRDAGQFFSALWPALQDAADAAGVAARQGLARRARKESDELRTLLERQDVAVRKAEEKLSQQTLFAVGDKDQKRQVEHDLEHLGRRRERIALELDEEPKAVEELYAVEMTRVTPVGLVVSWPEAMT